MKTKKEKLSVRLDDLHDSIDYFEDQLLSEKLKLSDSIAIKNTLHDLKTAARRYKYEYDFGEHEALVNAFMMQQPITRDIERYSNSKFALLADAFFTLLLDIAEFLVKPFYLLKRRAIRTLSRKHNTSRTVLADSVKIDSRGEACVFVTHDLTINSERQYIYLKHPSRKLYDLFTSPKVVLLFQDGTSNILEPAFWSYRIIAYNADQLNRFEAIKIEGVDKDVFKIMWVDTLNAKR